MNKKTILSGIALLSTTTLMYAMHHEHVGLGEFEEETPAQDLKITEKETVAKKKSNLLRNLCVLAPVGGVILAYNTNADVKKNIDSKKEKAKHFLLQKCIVPLHLRVEEIKEEGISKKDVLIVLSLIGGVYGLKKAWDFFKVSHALGKLDLGPTKKALRSAASFLADHKKKVGSFAAGCLATIAGWKAWKTVCHYSDVSPVDQFLLSLTDEQRKLIGKSVELQNILDQAQQDPLQMHSHEEFMKLLSEKQKNLVEHVVEDYIKNNPHLAFID